MDKATQKETNAERLKRVGLEAQCAELGRNLARCMPNGVGFTLLMFDFGTDGNIAYLSNAKRDDMCRALREFLSKVED